MVAGLAVWGQLALWMIGRFLSGPFFGGMVNRNVISESVRFLIEHFLCTVTVII